MGLAAAPGAGARRKPGALSAMAAASNIAAAKRKEYVYVPEASNSAPASIGPTDVPKPSEEQTIVVPCTSWCSDTYTHTIHA